MAIDPQTRSFDLADLSAGDTPAVVANATPGVDFPLPTAGGTNVSGYLVATVDVVLREDPRKRTLRVTLADWSSATVLSFTGDGTTVTHDAAADADAAASLVAWAAAIAGDATLAAKFTAVATDTTGDGSADTLVVQTIGVDGLSVNVSATGTVVATGLADAEQCDLRMYGRITDNSSDLRRTTWRRVYDGCGGYLLDVQVGRDGLMAPRVDIAPMQSCHAYLANVTGHLNDGSGVSPVAQSYVRPNTRQGNVSS